MAGGVYVYCKQVRYSSFALRRMRRNNNRTDRPAQVPVSRRRRPAGLPVECRVVRGPATPTGGAPEGRRCKSRRACVRETAPRTGERWKGGTLRWPGCRASLVVGALARRHLVRVLIRTVARTATQYTCSIDRPASFALPAPLAAAIPAPVTRARIRFAVRAPDGRASGRPLLVNNRHGGRSPVVVITNTPRCFVA